MMPEFNVGDIVRIRDWNEMEHEYHLDNDGDIKGPASYFSRHMKPLCGLEATIIVIEESVSYEGFKVYRLSDGICDRFYIYGWMLELVQSDTQIDFSDKDFDDLITQIK